MKYQHERPKEWHYGTRKGERVLIDPKGKAYHGTAREVRDAGLFPWVRDSLAESLSRCRSWANGNGYTPEQRAASCAIHRMDAIRRNATDASHSDTANDRRILIGACARYVGETPDEFVNGWIDDGIEATIEMAISDRPNEPRAAALPLTRHEIAALKSSLSTWSVAVAWQSDSAQ